jgi:L-cystine uptake protein TcyP (sodium:dicarboxylate symporter family)
MIVKEIYRKHKQLIIEALAVLVLGLVLGLIHVFLPTPPYNYQNQLGAFFTIVEYLSAFLIIVIARELLLHRKLSASEKYQDALHWARDFLPILLMVYLFNIFTVWGLVNFLLFGTILGILTPEFMQSSTQKRVTGKRAPL